MRKLLFVMIFVGFTLVNLRAENLDINALKKAYHWRDEEIAFGPITIEQAKQAIIAWSGRQNLAIDLAPYDDYIWDDESASWSRSSTTPLGIEGITVPYRYFPLMFRRYYVFKVNDPNPDGKYNGYISVDSWTGRVVGIDKGNLPEHEVLYLKEHRESVSDMISPQQAISLAHKYLSDYFPQIFQIVSTGYWGIDDPSLTSDKTTWLFFSPWIHVGYDKFPSEIGDVDIHIDVCLDCYAGKLARIDCREYDVAEISLKPDISKEEALEIALSFLYGLGAEHLELMRLAEGTIFREYPNGRQRVAYEVWFDNTKAREDAPREVIRLLGSAHIPHRIWVRVDIHTGEILHVEDVKLMCMRTKIFKHPHLFLNGEEKDVRVLLKNGEAFISIDDLKKIGVLVQLKGKGYVLRYGKENVSIEKEVQKINGSLYLNVQALNKLRRLKAIYSKTLKTIDIWTVQEKALKDAKELLKDKRFRLLNFLLGSGLISSAFSYLGWKLKQNLS
ncbi:MAG: hypothetical protein ACPLPS_10235 [bacterium]